MTVLDIIRKGLKMKAVPPKGENIGFDEFGAEVHPKGRAIEIPLRLRQVEGRDLAVLRMIRNELSRAADQRGVDSLEESDDFDVSELEDGDPMSPYEVINMQAEEPIADDKGQLNLPASSLIPAPVVAPAAPVMPAKPEEPVPDGKSKT